MPGSAKVQKGSHLASTRHSDPGSSSSVSERMEGSETALSGDLDCLAQHLEAVKQMHSSRSQAHLLQTSRSKPTAERYMNGTGHLLSILNTYYPPGLLVSLHSAFCNMTSSTPVRKTVDEMTVQLCERRENMANNAPPYARLAY